MSLHEDYSSDAFITEVKGTEKKGLKNEMLSKVRREHDKIEEVVQSFCGKVEGMIVKQRNEYIQAYENHMQDVQKELHNLREKVAEIANDDTKNEKTEQLKSDQIKFKNEALKLESDTDDLREQMRIIVRKIYSIEKARDWMLKKLRQAKKKYNNLVKERTTLNEELEMLTLSQTSLSNASTCTLEMKGSLKGGLSPLRPRSQQTNINNKKLKGRTLPTNAHARLELDFKVNRTNPLPSIIRTKKIDNDKSLEPYMKPWDSLVINTPNRRPQRQKSVATFPTPVPMSSASFQSLSRSGSFNLGDGTIGQDSNGPLPSTSFSYLPYNSQEEYNEQKKALAQLVAERTRKDEIRDLIRISSNSLHRGPWCRVKCRPMDDLMRQCIAAAEGSSEEFYENSTFMLQLACELAVLPETYEVILDLLDNPKFHRPNTSHNLSESDGGEGFKFVDFNEFFLQQEGSKHDNEEQSPTGTVGTDKSPYLGVNVTPKKSRRQSVTQEKISKKLQESFLDEVPSVESFKNDKNSFTPDKKSKTLESLADSLSQLSEEKEDFLDPDLMVYFKQEQNAKKLNDLGFYKQDSFLKFKS